MLYNYCSMLPNALSNWTIVKCYCKVSHISLCVVTHLFFFFACHLNFHSMFSLKQKLGVVRSVRFWCRDFIAQGSFFIQARVRVKQFGQCLCVRGEDQRIDIVSGWWCYRGYSMQGSPAVVGHPPGGLLQAETLSDGESARHSVWTGVISRTLLNEWDCMNSTTPPLSVFSHGFKASHCSEPTFLFTSALM